MTLTVSPWDSARSLHAPKSEPQISSFAVKQMGYLYGKFHLFVNLAVIGDADVQRHRLTADVRSIFDWRRSYVQ
jgi:hypothetical protein